VYKNILYGCWNLLALPKSAPHLDNMPSCLHLLWWKGVPLQRTGGAKALRTRREAREAPPLAEGVQGTGTLLTEKASSECWGGDAASYGNMHPTQMVDPATWLLGRRFCVVLERFRPVFPKKHFL